MLSSGCSILDSGCSMLDSRLIFVIEPRAPSIENRETSTEPKGLKRPLRALFRVTIHLNMV